MRVLELASDCNVIRCRHSNPGYCIVRQHCCEPQKKKKGPVLCIYVITVAVKKHNQQKKVNIDKNGELRIVERRAPCPLLSLYMAKIEEFIAEEIMSSSCFNKQMAIYVCSSIYRYHSRI